MGILLDTVEIMWAGFGTELLTASFPLHNGRNKKVSCKVQIKIPLNAE